MHTRGGDAAASTALWTGGGTTEAGIGAESETPAGSVASAPARGAELETGGMANAGSGTLDTVELEDRARKAALTGFDWEVFGTSHFDQ